MHCARNSVGKEQNFLHGKRPHRTGVHGNKRTVG
jgi:hypothetical protein